MQIVNNAASAITDGREGIQSVLNWFVVNRAELPIGLASAIIIVGVMLSLRLLGTWLVGSDPEYRHWRGVIGRVLQKTTILFMVAAALDMVANYTAVPVKVERLLNILFTVAFAIQGAIWARELILGLIGRRVAEDSTGSLISAMAIIRLLVSITLFAIAGILILDNLGVNVTALVAGLGIGGIAIGLAAQGIFADLFAALSILFDKPFRKGDTIRYDQSTGTVERIGLKTTRLRSQTGEQLIMSNTKLLEREIHNLAAATGRRVTLYLAVGGESSSAAVDAVIAAAGQSVGEVKGCHLVRCTLSGAGADALAFSFVYDDTTIDPDRLAANRSIILRDFIGRLAERKLRLARASDQPPAPLPF